MSFTASVCVCVDDSAMWLGYVIPSLCRCFDVFDPALWTWLAADCGSESNVWQSENLLWYVSSCSTILRSISYIPLAGSTRKYTPDKCLKPRTNAFPVSGKLCPGVHSFLPFSPVTPVRLSRDWLWAIHVLDWESGATVPHTQYSYHVCKHTCPVHRICCVATMFSPFSTMCFPSSCFCIMYSVSKHVFRLCVVQCTDVCRYCSS
jgi:hypothetical protein